MHIHEILQFVQKPLVNLGKFMKLLDRIIFIEHGLSDGQPPAIGRVSQGLIEIFKLVALEAEVFRIDLTNGFLERFFKSTADCHNLTNGLHGAANIPLHMLEFS